MSTLAVRDDGTFAMLQAGVIQQVDADETCCCTGDPCPDPGECVDCPHYLFMSGTTKAYLYADGTMAPVEDASNEGVTLETIQLRGYLHQGCSTSIVDGQCCETYSCEWGGYVQWLSPSGWTFLDTGFTAINTDGNWVISLTASALGGAWFKSASVCATGSYTPDPVDVFYAGTSLTLVPRAYNADYGDICCECDAPCQGCKSCASGPSTLDALATIDGTPHTISGYRESDDPCTYLFDVDATYGGSSLYFEAAGTDEYGNVHGDRFRVQLYVSGVLKADAVLECSGTGDEQMLGSYAALTGSGLSVGVTVA